MRTRTARLATTLTALAFTVGCSDSPTQASTANASLDVVLDQMAFESNGRGDADAAAAFSGGALAIRLGVHPTEISVSVGGESIRYMAVVTGVSETTAGGAQVIRRSLVAWTGTGRPTAFLQVNSLGDEGTFGGGSGPRTNGLWTNLANRSRWIASDGAANLMLTSTGENCTSASARALDIRCALARYRVAVDGLFRQVTSRDAVAGEAVRILVDETGVAGVLLSRNSNDTRPVQVTPRPGR